jgi:hypothetical protein
MSHFIKIGLALLLLAICHLLSAQNRTGYVTGPKGEPVEFATVAIFNGDKPIANAISDSIGRFTLSVANGKYQLKIRNIAYKPIDEEITVSNQALGDFRLTETAIGLSEVVVQASAITREADRFVMRIDKTPASLNKDASEVLRLAPGVWIDENGVSINGASGSKVFINEREIKLSGKDLYNYLRNIQSSNIARVEVIPQAGAEYSADTNGGVVKIILRRQIEKGMNGNFIFNTLQGKYLGEYDPSATVNISSNKWTFDANASGNITTAGKNEMTATRAYHNGDDTNFESQSLMNQKTRSGIGRISAIYDADKRNSFGAEIEYSKQSTPNPTSANTIIGQNGVMSYGSSQYQQNETAENFNALFNYILKIDSLGSTLKVITNYTKKKVTGKNDYYSYFTTGGFASDSTYRSNSTSDYKIVTADAMINKILPGVIKYSAGMKYTRNSIADTVRYESYSTAGWTTLPDYSFLLKYTENIGALYGTLAATIHQWSLSGGLRGEYTSIDGQNGYISRHYFDLFPSVNVTYSFDAMRTFMLIGQYSRNIERPNFWYLNPNRVQYSDYSYMVGNPELRPTYINNIGMTAVYRYRYILSFGGHLHHDLIREVCKIDPANPKTTYITPENHYSENHYYIALIFPLKPIQWCNMNFNLVGVKQDIRATANDPVMSHYLYFANVTAGFKLPEKYYLELSYSGTSRLYSANSGINQRQLFHAVVKKQLFGDRVSAAVGINNIFDSKTSYFSNTPYFTINSKGTEAQSSRYVKLSIQYNFKSGKSFKKRAIENTSEEEKSRLEKSTGIK